MIDAPFKTYYGLYRAGILRRAASLTRGRLQFFPIISIYIHSYNYL
jgi:hypothetical protein